MTEASGKKNRMFAGNNKPNKFSWLIPVSLFVCVSSLPAQQQQEEGSQPTDSRRIERLGEVSTEEWEMDLSLSKAAPVSSSESGEPVLPDADQDKALQQLLSKLANEPGNSQTLAQLRSLLSDVLEQANGLMDLGSFDQAEGMLVLIRSIDPGLSGLEAAQRRLKTSKDTIDLLIAGNAALESERILQPEDNNANYYFNLALSRDPDSQAARDGLTTVQRRLVDVALESARELDFETAETWLLKASSVQENQEVVNAVRLEVATFKQERAIELEQKAISAMNSGSFVLADFSIIDLIALGGQEARVDSLRIKLEEVRLYGGFEPGQLLKDELLQSGGYAPEIVIISAGSFLMGSNGRSDDAKANEKPQHRVTFQFGFAIGVREVSVEEFQLFIMHSGYQTAADRSGSSRVYDEAAGRLTSRTGVNWKFDYKGKKAKPGMPVLHVSYLDALAYVTWLARETGKGYRLPSEAEYEYVARAGGNGNYWWGEGSPTEVVENLSGDRDTSPRNREWTNAFKKYGDGHWGPGPTGSIGDGKNLHPMGVYDIAGNVREWVEDCWHQNYIKAPVDGSAWVNPGCNSWVARGGYWASGPEQSRATFRIPANANSAGPVIGIRIARDL